MNRKLVQALDDCLRGLQAGETLEAVLVRYPHLAGELRPLLTAAQAAQATGQRPIPERAQARGRLRVLAAAEAMRSKAGRRAGGRPWRVTFAALAVVLFMFIGGTGLLTASAESLPGEPLYPLKRLVEDVQLRLAADPNQKQVLEEEFYQRRVEETESLLVAGRVEMVEFDGLVEAQTPDGWIVEGIPVVLTSQTVINGTIAVGSEVDVSGRTDPSGSVQAVTITVKGEGVGDLGEEDGNGSSHGGEGTPGPNRTETDEAEQSDPGENKTETPESTGSHGGNGGETSGVTDSGPGGEPTPEPPTESTDNHSGDGD